jgi:uroporphyrinogen-III synthase
VTAATAYRTAAASPEVIRPLPLALEAGAVHAVTFASPSAVKSVVAALADAARLLSTVVVAAIGPTTAEAARELGVEVRVVPREHSARALADALGDALGPM